MKNFKRALSLALASVMVVGMTAAGASAKGLEDFNDRETILAAGQEVSEAVAITGAIDIFEGYTNGEFGGDKVVTRAEMAVIICKMLYGADVNVEQFKATKVFSDVPTWAEGYINLCASLGIVVGVGNGKFDPESTVTTAEAAVMLTKTLGYFKNENDFGNNWALAATSKATQLGLYGNLKLNATAGLTRNNVAVMVFNALTEAVPVEYNEILNIYYTVNNASGNNSGNFSIVFDYLDTLAYNNFDLVYKRVDEADAFGRPGKIWGVGTYKGTTDNKGNLQSSGQNIATITSKNEIIQVADEADLVYVGTVKQKDLVSDAGKDVTWDVAYVDGAKEDITADPSSSSSDKFEYSAKGAVTEVFLDSNNTATVVQYYSYLSTVGSVESDSDGRFVTLKSGQHSVDVDEVYTEQFAKNDVVAFNVGENSKDEAYVAQIGKPTIVEGVIDAKADNYVRIDGVKYEYAEMFNGNYNSDALTKSEINLNDEYKVYVDAGGFVLGLEPLTEQSRNYLYVHKAAEADLYDDEYQARVTFADGTTAIIDTKNLAVAKNVYTYTVNSKGVYTLTLVGSSMGTGHEIENSKGTVKDSSGSVVATVDDETIFVDVKSGKVYEGFEAVIDYKNAEIAYNDKDGRYADVMFIVDGNAADNTFFYIVKADSELVEFDGEVYKKFTDAYIDGTKKPVYVLESAASSIAKGNLYEITELDDNGFAETVVLAEDISAGGTATAVGNRVFTVDGTSYTKNSDTVIVLVTVTSSKTTVKTGDMEDMKIDGALVTVVAKESGDIAEVVYIFVDKT